MNHPDTLESRYPAWIAAAADQAALEAVRPAAPGEKGETSALMATLDSGVAAQRRALRIADSQDLKTGLSERSRRPSCFQSGEA